MGMFILSLDCASKIQLALQSVHGPAVVRAPSLLGGYRLHPRRTLQARAARRAKTQA